MFRTKGTRYAVVGGLGLILRGRPRFTQNVDILLDVPQLVLPGLLDDLAERGFTFDATAVITGYVRHHMTAFDYRAVRIDWLKPVLPLYTRTLADATEVSWTDGYFPRVATAEGLILTKMLAYRLQDQADIESLIIANRDALDATLIRTEWAPFADKQPERTAWLEGLLATHVGR